MTVSRQATCSKCQGWLRTCLNCRFYDPRSKNECAEPVRDKDTANFCELFAANTKSGAATPKAAASEDPFEALFKK